MERRDRLITSAMLTKRHKFAKEAISDYEVEPPRRSYDQFAVKNLKYTHQTELMEYWKKGIRAIMFPIYFVDGLSDYTFKFPYMISDMDKSFLKALQATLNNEPRAINHPCAFKEVPSERQRLLAITDHTPSLPETMSTDIPSYEDLKQARLQYDEEMAPFQTALQRRTSELTLTTAPPVETFAPLEIATMKIEQAAEADYQRRNDATSDILAFCEDLLKAQLFEGKIYDGLSDVEKKIFEAEVNTPPPRERIEWLADKLDSHQNLTYEKFLNNLCFVHVQNVVVDGEVTKQYVLNYVHQKHLMPCKYENRIIFT